MRIRENLFPIFVGIASFLFFLFFQATGIYGGDSGDLVTAAATFGVPHPPGYPLYTLLGWLFTKLPLATPAWRVGLLSSIPHAITVALVYWWVKRITKQWMAGLFAGIVLAGNYLFFLYSVTAEVFALFDLFVILLAVLLFQWRETRDNRYLYAASFIFGLSLSHHHVILFMVPALLYFTYKVSPLKVGLKRSIYKVRPLKVFGCFFIGLLSYLYLPIAGSGSSIINWNRPDTLANFIRLVSRADYGTFVSGGFYGGLLIQRIAQVKAYAQFLRMDIGGIGLILAAFGLYWLWRCRRDMFWFMILAIVSVGPLFFFYASFPLVNRFTLGTYERFLLPSYTMLAILMGVGVSAIIHFSLKRPRLFRLGIVVILFSLPVAIGTMTLWRFWGLRGDRTADYLSQDILTSVDTGSILFLQRDTPLFTTQYARYALGIRPDVLVVQSSRLGTEDYAAVLARVFPGLSLPRERGETFQAELVKANRDRFPIFSNGPFAVEAGWVWVPRGLVYQLIREDQVPSVTDLTRQNEELWSTYHDPTSGILSRYNHLMLSDVRDVYAGARLELGKTLLRAGNTDRARMQFEKAIVLGGDTQTSDAYTYLGLSYLFTKNCSGALRAFARAREVGITPDDSLLLYEGVTYRDCVGDAARAKELLDAYEKLRKKAETPLSPH